MTDLQNLIEQHLHDWRQAVEHDWRKAPTADEAAESLLAAMTEAGWTLTKAE